jgi:hypothetical protein
MLHRRFAVLVGVAVFICSTALHGIAHAATATCGQVITQDTTLDADVGPCVGNGIVIGANNITLDLNGHTVFGSLTAPTPGPGFSGILVQGFSGIRIHNGTVMGFGTGVTVSRSTSTTLERLAVRDNRCDGIVFAGGQSPPFTTGGALFENSIRGNGCSGMRLFSRVIMSVAERNAISGNARQGIILDSLGLIGSSRIVTLRSNSISGNGDDGITVTLYSVMTNVVGNVIRLNRGNGLRVQSFAPTNVEGNQVLGNRQNGVLVERFASARVVNNLATGNGLLTVLPGQTPSYDLADQNPACGGNTWAGNRFVTRNQPCIN